ncbi:SIS domain-containing protein [Enterococcus sp. AZ163]|uniref:SIS domain-containing protein n=1 Tax=Enterococcus sp. AZ163 TaxID=2774638 RepID=UPI003D2734CB
MATMLDYIHEEEPMLLRILDNFSKKTETELENCQNILVLATGSSYNACLAAKVALEQLGNVTITIEEPYHFQHYGKLSSAIDTVVAVSQSGKSASTIYALEALEQSELYTIALTSNLESSLAQKADRTIDLNIGVETVGFVTKGYVATVLQLMLLGLAIGQAKGLPKETIQQTIDELRQLVKRIPSIIEVSEAFFKRHEAIFKLSERFIGIGYGANWGTVKEFETKFTETVRKPSQGFELEAYMHGPYLEADSQHILFFVETVDENAKRAAMLRGYMEPAVGQTFTVTAGISKEENVLGLEIEGESILSSLVMVIPFQLFACRTAAAKGIDLSQRIFDNFDDVLKSKL